MFFQFIQPYISSMCVNSSPLASLVREGQVPWAMSPAQCGMPSQPGHRLSSCLVHSCLLGAWDSRVWDQVSPATLPTPASPTFPDKEGPPPAPLPVRPHPASRPPSHSRHPTGPPSASLCQVDEHMPSLCPAPGPQRHPQVPSEFSRTSSRTLNLAPGPSDP